MTDSPVIDDGDELPSRGDDELRSAVIAHLEAELEEYRKRESEYASIVWHLTEQLRVIKEESKSCPICPSLRLVLVGRGSL